MTGGNSKWENRNEILKEFERRSIERRARERRISGSGIGYLGIEKRHPDSDRRITIINRLNHEVSDRRASG
jgi:hypothetical protein